MLPSHRATKEWPQSSQRAFTEWLQSTYKTAKDPIQSIKCFTVVIKLYKYTIPKSDHIRENFETPIFFGELDKKNVEKKDPARNLIFLEANKEVLKVQDKYKIAVKENKLATEMI